MELSPKFATVCEKLMRKGFYPIPEAARRAGISPSTIYRRIKADDLKKTKAGLVSLAAVERCMAERRTGRPSGEHASIARLLADKYVGSKGVTRLRAMLCYCARELARRGKADVVMNVLGEAAKALKRGKDDRLGARNPSPVAIKERSKVTISEASIFRCTRSTIHRWIREKRLKKVSGLVDLADVERCMAKWRTGRRPRRVYYPDEQQYPTQASIDAEPYLAAEGVGRLRAMLCYCARELARRGKADAVMNVLGEAAASLQRAAMTDDEGT